MTTPNGDANEPPPHHHNQCARSTTSPPKQQPTPPLSQAPVPFTASPWSDVRCTLHSAAGTTNGTRNGLRSIRIREKRLPPRRASDGAFGPPQFAVRQGLDSIPEDDVVAPPQLCLAVAPATAAPVGVAAEHQSSPQLSHHLQSLPLPLPLPPQQHQSPLALDGVDFVFRKLSPTLFQGVVPATGNAIADSPLLLTTGATPIPMPSHPTGSLQVLPPSHEQRCVRQSRALGVSKPWSVGGFGSASTRQLALKIILNSGLHSARSVRWFSSSPVNTNTSDTAAASAGTAKAAVSESQPTNIRVDPTSAVGTRQDDHEATLDAERKARSLLAPAHRQHLSQMNKAPYSLPSAEQEKVVAERHQREGTTEADAEHHPATTGTEDEFLVYHDLTLQDIIREKAHREVLCIGEEETIYEAIRVMDVNKVGGLLVRSSDGKQITGIVTERDYMTKVALRQLSSRDTKVGVIMTKDVKFGRGTMLSRKALALMTNHRFRHLPVLDDDGGLLGLVSIGDLVKAILSETAESALYYRDFVEGNYRYSGSQGQAHAAKQVKEAAQAEAEKH